MSADADAAGSRAVILLSGGMDSATVLALARRRHERCCALSFMYGQRHSAELEAARRIASRMGVERHYVARLDAALFESSALVDERRAIPAAGASRGGTDIPATYVPARNLVFLSMALAWCETLRARDVYIGVNAVDYSGYPDCRPAFIEGFERLAAIATRAGVQGERFRVHGPLIDMSKAGIIKAGLDLGVDYALTVSCYQANERGEACGRCDACELRRRGFADAGVADPTRYQ